MCDAPRSLFPAVLLLALCAPCRAATPRDELLRLVPDDVGFCLVVQDLRGQVGSFLASPFAARLARAPFVKGLLASPEVRQFHKTEQVLEKHLGTGWAGLRDDVFGDAVVFAYRPGPPGRADAEQGVFLVRVRSARSLSDLIDRFNAAQKEAGELQELAEREHRGVKYFKRADRKDSGYYCLRGPVLMYSGQEAMLRQVLDRELSQPQDAEPPAARQLRGLGLERSLVALWLNPRALDGAVEGGLRGQGKALDQGARTFLLCWKALGGAGIGVHADRDLHVRVAVKARVEDLPSPARRFLGEASRISEAWKVVPDDALLAVGGRFDLAALFGMAGEFMSKDGRETLHADLERGLGSALGKSVIKDVLPALGPDWGFALVGPGDVRSWAPQGLLAVRLAAGPDDSPVDQAVLAGLHSWAVLAVLAHNRQHPGQPIRLRSADEPGSKVRYFEGDQAFPAGVRPAFGLKGGYLLVGSSPELIRRFTLKDRGAGEGPVPLLRASLAGWRAYLEGQRDVLVSVLAGEDEKSRTQARERLDGLRAVLDLLERVDVRQESGPGQVAFILKIQPRWSLARE